MEQGENTASAPAPPEDPNEDRKPLTIRCLLLFDGTLNNKKNIEERHNHESGQGSKAYLEHRKNKNKEQRLAQGAQGADLEDDSYENDFSNIVTLEQNIAPEQSDFTDTVIVYTEGAGTMDLGTDKQGGYAFAAGESGVKAKVDKAIGDMILQISKGSGPSGKRNPEEFIIKKLTIDVFGFSRGAASARYSIYRLLKDQGEENPVAYIKKRLQDLWFEVGDDIEVCFVGLFDTVSAYYSAQIVKLLPLENWFVKLQAITKAKKVVHLASAEEHRYHFSLHNIKSAGDKGEQYFLPGVHSDIGGGYLDSGSDAGLIVFEGNKYYADKDRAEYLVARGWYEQNELIEETLRANEVGDPEFVRLTVAREPGKARTIHNAYCKIPLKLMAEFAGKSNINIKPDLEEKATETINVFSELATLEAKIKSYIGSVGPLGSVAADWQKPAPDLNAIRHRHLHFSARYNTFFGHNPRRTFFTNQRQRYEFDG